MQSSISYRLRRNYSILLIVVATLAAALPAAWAQSAAQPLRAAAARIDITPTGPAFIAGYAPNRRSIDAHDPLTARCIVLESAGVRIALVSGDLIGVPRGESEKIRASIHAVPAERVYIGATHTHSGPDTVGQWGPDFRTRGVDDVWLADTRRRIAALVDSTAQRLRPATLKFAVANGVQGVSKNIRVPRILDTEMSLMQVTDRKDGKTIATLVNYACHPEILNTRHISADFPQWLYQTVETAAGGICVYFNGAQGGMITADFDETTAPKGQNWQAAETIGRRLGEYALRALEKAEPAQNTAITTGRRIFTVPLENVGFKSLIKLHVFPADTLKNGEVETEVDLIRIGPAEMLTIPGEALPNVGFYLKRSMAGAPKFLLGLTCDFLGYILAPEDFGLELYDYETRVSVGSLMEPRMVQNQRALLAGPELRAGKR